jgi:hypothetical protein
MNHFENARFMHNLSQFLYTHMTQHEGKTIEKQLLIYSVSNKESGLQVSFRVVPPNHDPNKPWTIRPDFEEIQVDVHHSYLTVALVHNGAGEVYVPLGQRIPRRFDSDKTINYLTEDGLRVRKPHEIPLTRFKALSAVEFLQWLVGCAILTSHTRGKTRACQSCRHQLVCLEHSET